MVWVMRWFFGVAVALALSAVILYASRYWQFDLWERDGLFGWEVLRPQGDLITRWARGTPAAPFALLLWGIGVFALLSVIEWVRKLLFERNAGADEG